MTPAMLELALSRLGVAAAQLRAIDTETKKAFVRLFMAAVQSGDANAYLKERLAWIEARDDAPEPPPAPPPSTRGSPFRRPVAEASFDDGRAPSRSRR